MSGTCMDTKNDLVCYTQTLQQVPAGEASHKTLALPQPPATTELPRNCLLRWHPEPPHCHARQQEDTAHLDSAARRSLLIPQRTERLPHLYDAASHLVGFGVQQADGACMAWQLVMVPAGRLALWLHVACINIRRRSARS